MIEEEVPLVPRYDQMSCVAAVGKKGQALGELLYPFGVAVDENTRSIYVAEGLVSEES